MCLIAVRGRSVTCHLVPADECHEQISVSPAYRRRGVIRICCVSRWISRIFSRTLKRPYFERDKSLGKLRARRQPVARQTGLYKR